MLKRLYIGIGALLVGAGLCAADSISFEGKTLENVYIREGASMYYVQLPTDGTVTSVPKSRVGNQDVVISTDKAQRDALLTEWKRNNDKLRTPPVQDNVPAPQQTVAPRAPSGDIRAAQPIRSASAANEPSDDMIPRVKLKNVPLRDALKATLRPLNLDYTVEKGYIRIAPPDKLRHEPYENLETRYYELKGASGETLPKVVVRNPGAAVTGGAPGYGNGPGGGYRSGFSPGYGGGGYSGGGYGGGTGPYGGGYGGGMGMSGGGFQGGYISGPQFSNIAELFTTIDDRLVGEPPAQIGIGGLR